MLLPRPEIRMATRLGSRIVGSAPVPGRAPAAAAAVHRAAARSLFDPADLEPVLVPERRSYGLALVRFDDQHHSNSAVEGPRHFLGLDLPSGLELGEDRRKQPRVRIDVSMAAIRQNPRNVFKKPATGDVRQAPDQPALDQREKQSDVNPRWFEQHFAKGSPTRTGQALGKVPAVLLDDPSDKRKAVAVHARAF